MNRSECKRGAASTTAATAATATATTTATAAATAAASTVGELARIAAAALVLQEEVADAGLAVSRAALGLLWPAATAAEAEDEVERRLLRDAVLTERAAVLELLAGDDEALLIRRDALLVLDRSLHVLDRVA